MSDAG
jgi:uncharacterized protein involved in copper resistance